MVYKISEDNFVAAVAMAGKNCVAIGSDLRLGVQLQTLATDYKKVYKVHDHLFFGLSGLASDADTLYVVGVITDDQTILEMVSCSSQRFVVSLMHNVCLQEPKIHVQTQSLQTARREEYKAIFIRSISIHDAV